MCLVTRRCYIPNPTIGRALTGHAPRVGRKGCRTRTTRSPATLSMSAADDASTLLYELVLHGVGWRFEQEEDAETPLGWRTVRELPPGEGEVELEFAPAEASEREQAASAKLVAALTEFDTRTLARLLLPQRLVTLSAWALREGTALSAQLAGGRRGRGQGVVYALERQQAQLPAWKLALCHGGELLAVWRADDLALLSARDNFATPVASWAAGADSSPHCRLLAWTPDYSLLAAASSDGAIQVLDARARPLHRLLPSMWASAAFETGEHGTSPSVAAAAGVAAAVRRAPLAAMAFRAPRDGGAGGDGARRDGSTGWELLLLACDWALHRVSMPSAAATTVHGARPSRSAAPPLSLAAHHAVVSCMHYDACNGLLAIGGTRSIVTA